MRLFRYRPLILLPAVAILIAAAILWGGLILSKQTRWERIEQDREVVRRFGQALQERLDQLETRYHSHLETLSRENPSDSFNLRDAMDRIVGVRQFSTLDSDGKVAHHFLSSEVTEDEASVPLPVFDKNDLPVGRRQAFMIENRRVFGQDLGVAEFAKNSDSRRGRWQGSGEDLFYFHPITARRTVWLLIDRAAVTASIRGWLDDWLKASDFNLEAGSLAVVVGGEEIAAFNRDTTALRPGDQADVILQLNSRFGDWQIQSRDPRRLVVEYDTWILVGTGLLALLVVIAGGATFFYLHRALRLAERRVSFVNHVSHELKTPLTNILLNTDLAADGASPAGRKRLAMVQEEARRLSRLIDNVLTYSQRDKAPGNLDLSTTDLGRLIAEVVEQFLPSLERRGIKIMVTGTPTATVLVNEDAFSQILGNLLSNLEKYAASGGIAHLSWENRDREVVVQLRDGGPGIPRRERERVFRPFYRLNDHTAEGASGTGLGLSIARDLAERMGGSLRVVSTNEPDKNEPGTGAVFELRLPAAAAANIVTFPDSHAS